MIALALATVTTFGPAGGTYLRAGAVAHPPHARSSAPTSGASLSVVGRPGASSGARGVVSFGAPLASFGHRDPSAPSPRTCFTCAYYLQEGATLDQACAPLIPGACNAWPGFHSWGVQVNISTAPYPTGYEFNGLSNTGDWYQSMVLFNWCGGPPFGWGNEAFDRNGTSVYPSGGGVGCYSGPTFAAGDLVELGVEIVQNGSDAGKVCFYAQDVTQAQIGYYNCIAQPDPGPTPDSNYFRWGGSGGFFSGPMVEFLNPNATGCTNFTGLPTVDFRTIEGAYVTQFSPFSDLWDPSTGAICYTTIGAGSNVTEPVNDSTQFLVDGSGGSVYGPHWLLAGNISATSSTDWWSISTDARPPAPEPYPRTMDVGQYPSVRFVDNLSVLSLDGRSTGMTWDRSPGLAGCTVSPSSTTLSCPAPGSPGNYSASLVVGEIGGTSVATGNGTLSVYLPPTAARPDLGRPSVDVGQTVSLRVNVSNGSGGFVYHWSGLPSGCDGPYIPEPTCTPVSPGTSNVSVQVTDSSGVVAQSPTLVVPIYSDPIVALAPGMLSQIEIDVGQHVAFSAVVTGGAPNDSFGWTGAPAGCPSAALSPTWACTVNSAGTYSIGIRATDSSGFAAQGPTVRLTVRPDPTANLTASSSTVTLGQGVLFEVNITGGVAPYRVSWTGLPPGCSSQNATSIDCLPTGVGSFTVNVTAWDVVGRGANATWQLSVQNAPGPASWGIPLAIAAAAAVALIAVIVVTVRRRRGRDLPPDTPSEPTDAGEGGEPGPDELGPPGSP